LGKAIEFRGIDRAKKFQQIGIGSDLPSSDELGGAELMQPTTRINAAD
jgi:hypothetical protein